MCSIKAFPKSYDITRNVISNLRFLVTLHFPFSFFSRDKSAEEATKDVIENQLPQIANLVAKGTLQVSVIYGKKLQGMAIKFKVEQQRITSAQLVYAVANTQKIINCVQIKLIT